MTASISMMPQLTDAGRRTDLTSAEYLHELDPQPQIALIVADHGFATEQQRTRMINVDICSGSQS